LINGDGMACLSDFGLSTIKAELQSNSYLTSSIGGNVRFAAPEIYQRKLKDVDESNSTHSPSKQGDIYSFGGVMLQVSLQTSCESLLCDIASLDPLRKITVSRH